MRRPGTVTATTTAAAAHTTPFTTAAPAGLNHLATRATSTSPTMSPVVPWEVRTLTMRPRSRSGVLCWTRAYSRISYTVPAAPPTASIAKATAALPLRPKPMTARPPVNAATSSRRPGRAARVIQPLVAETRIAPTAGAV